MVVSAMRLKGRRAHNALDAFIGRGFDSRRLHQSRFWWALPQQGLWGRHGFDGDGLYR
jgi:hypothetical protein